MLRLQTLGGLYVVGEAGQPITGAATQRRLLALLAALAVAGDRGLSRDKLIALLWPEADEERARHSLTQGLYAARRALGVDDLFVVGGDIRLRRDRCGSDVQDLEEALEAGDLERAVALYTGPFTDGFFLPGSGEFEQWTSAERARLEDRIVGALDCLATEAEAAGRARDALAWRKRLAAIRPFDASAAVGLMRMLAQAGDRAGALRHAQLHQSLLREHLELEPDPVVTSLAARLREPAEWNADRSAVAAGGRRPAPAGEHEPVAGAVIERRGVGEPAVSDATPALALAADADPRTRSIRPAPGRAPSGAPRRARGLRWWLSGMAACVAAAVALVVHFAPASSPSPTRAVAPRIDQKVVVAPFRVAGASSTLAYLREGLVELLSTRLADDSSARSVDAGAVLAAWRAAGLGGSSDVPRGTVVRVAEGLGAERVVVGSVVGTSSRVVLTAGVVDVATGQATDEATVEGAADSITTLVDRLAARLLVLDAGEDASLATRTTGSLYALRAFLDGQAAFRRGSYTLASRRYEAALRVDSTFALAALQLARSADRLHAVEPRMRALALAWLERDALDARARALLGALSGPGYPAPSDAGEQVAAWERLVDLTPDRAEAWFELGARLFTEGAVAAEPDAASRALVALRRAVQLDSTHEPTRELLAQLALEAASAAGAPHSNFAAADSGLALAPFLRWRSAVGRGDAAALRRLRSTFSRLGPRNLRAIAAAAQLDRAALADARLALEQLRARAVRPEDRIEAALADHALALNEGRLRDALAATERLAQVGPGAQPQLRLRILDALYGDGDTHAAEAAARALQRSVGMREPAEPPRQAIRIANACVLAQWRLHHGDTTGVHRLVERLRQAPLSTIALAPPVATAPRACAELLDATLVVALGRPEAAQAVARLDSLVFAVGSAGDAIAYAPLLIARLHERLGQPRLAYDAVRRREDMVGWPRYLATAWREEGRYAAAAGAPDAARRALAKYLDLRKAADAELRGKVEAVRQEMAALGRPESRGHGTP